MDVSVIVFDLYINAYVTGVVVSQNLPTENSIKNNVDGIKLIGN